MNIKILVLLLLISSIAFASPDYSFETAKNIIYKSVITPSELSENAKAKMYSSIIKKGTIISDGTFLDIELQDDAYFAWLDPDAKEKYGHGTAYIFLYDDDIQTVIGNGWPIINGDSFLSANTKSVEIFSGRKNEIPNTDTFVSPVPKDVIKIQRLKYRFPHIDTSLKVTNSNVVINSSEKCPVGYIEKEVKIQEHGLGFTVIGPEDPNYDFSREASGFESALLQGGFPLYPPAQTLPELQTALNYMTKNLEPASTFAMYIGTHGLELFDVTIKNVRTGEEMDIDDFPGDPFSETKPDANRYSNCFEADNKIKNNALCNELKAHSAGIPDANYVFSKKRSGWCFSLGDKCVKFDTNKALGPIQSCRKFLVVDACYSGAITKHTVKGLSTYASSLENQQSGGEPAPQGTKTIGLFASIFNNALLNKPPTDPKNPDIEEPKPKFDSAYAKASSIVVPGNKVQKIYTIRQNNIAYVTTVSQQPIEHSKEGDKDCSKKIQCVPIFRPIDENSIVPNSCDALKAYALQVPEIVQKMFTEGDKFRPDRTRVAKDMMERLEELKKCYQCHEGMKKEWFSCDPYSNEQNIINGMTDKISAILKSGFKSDPSAIDELTSLSSALNRCQHKCVPPPEAIIDTNIYQSCKQLSADYFDSKAECTKNCFNPPCRKTKTALECYECPSIIEDFKVVCAMPSPPYYISEEACKERCTTKCRLNTNVQNNVDCYECASILEELSKGPLIDYETKYCRDGVEYYWSNLNQQKSFEINIPSGFETSAFIKSGNYQLAGDASGNIEISNNKISFTPNKIDFKTGTIRVSYFGEMRNKIIEACPNKAAIAQIALQYVNIEYEKPKNIGGLLIDFIPRIRLDTIQTISQIIPTNNINLGLIQNNNANLVIKLNPITSTINTAVLGYPRQASQYSMGNAFSFGMFG